MDQHNDDKPAMETKYQEDDLHRLSDDELNNVMALTLGFKMMTDSTDPSYLKDKFQILHSGKNGILYWWVKPNDEAVAGMLPKFSTSLDAVWCWHGETYGDSLKLLEAIWNMSARNVARTICIHYILRKQNGQGSPTKPLDW